MVHNHKITLEEKGLQICLFGFLDQQLYIYSRHTITVNRNMHRNEFDRCTSTKNWKYAEDSEQKKAGQLPDSSRKDKASKSKSQKMGWVKLFLCNRKCECCNWFLLFVMHWQVSGRKQKSHCNIKISTYSYIFLSELEKKWEGRRLRGMTIHFEFLEENKQS